MTDHSDFGYLTTAQWEWFNWAVSSCTFLLPFLHEAGNYSVSVDEGRTSRTEPSIGMPATRIAHIEITRLLDKLSKWDSLADAANDIEGSEIARDLTREVRIAYERWPMEDDTHDVQELRCTKCGMLALVYTPPREFGDDYGARCGECGEMEPHDEYTERLITAREELARYGARK